MSPEQLHSTTSNGSESASDEPYFWGRPPGTYLAPRQIVRLMIFRSRLDDRHLLRGRAPAGNSTN
jgi:hypothetical protein